VHIGYYLSYITPFCPTCFCKCSTNIFSRFLIGVTIHFSKHIPYKTFYMEKLRKEGKGLADRLGDNDHLNDEVVQAIKNMITDGVGLLFTFNGYQHPTEYSCHGVFY